MNRHHSRFALLITMFIGLVVTVSHQTHAADADITQMFKAAEVSHVSISPDGEHVAMVRGSENNDTRILFKRPLASRTIVTGVDSAKGVCLRRGRSCSGGRSKLRV